MYPNFADSDARIMLVQCNTTSTILQDSSKVCLGLTLKDCVDFHREYEKSAMQSKFKT